MTASPTGMRHTAIATSSDTASAQAAETYADLRKTPIRMRRNARGTTAASADKAMECNTGSIGWCHMLMATLLLECRLASAAPCEFRNRSRYPITAFKRLRRSVAVIDLLSLGAFEDRAPGSSGGTQARGDAGRRDGMLPITDHCGLCSG